MRSALEQDSWRVEQLGLPASSSSLSRRVFDRGQDVASVNISEEGNLVFAGPCLCHRMTPCRQCLPLTAACTDIWHATLYTTLL